MRLEHLLSGVSDVCESGVVLIEQSSKAHKMSLGHKKTTKSVYWGMVSIVLILRLILLYIGCYSLYSLVAQLVRAPH